MSDFEKLRKTIFYLKYAISLCEKELNREKDTEKFNKSIKKWDDADRKFLEEFAPKDKEVC